MFLKNSISLTQQTLIGLLGSNNNLMQLLSLSCGTTKKTMYDPMVLKFKGMFSFDHQSGKNTILKAKNFPIPWIDKDGKQTTKNIHLTLILVDRQEIFIGERNIAISGTPEGISMTDINDMYSLNTPEYLFRISDEEESCDSPLLLFKDSLEFILYQSSFEYDNQLSCCALSETDESPFMIHSDTGLLPLCIRDRVSDSQYESDKTIYSEISLLHM